MIYLFILPLVLQVNANASLTMSLAQTPYCKKEGYDPQNPLCAHVIFSGIVEKVHCDIWAYQKNIKLTGWKLESKFHNTDDICLWNILILKLPSVHSNSLWKGSRAVCAGRVSKIPVLACSIPKLLHIPRCEAGTKCLYVSPCSQEHQLCRAPNHMKWSAHIHLKLFWVVSTTIQKRFGVDKGVHMEMRQNESSISQPEVFELTEILCWILPYVYLHVINPVELSGT